MVVGEPFTFLVTGLATVSRVDRRRPWRRKLAVQRCAVSMAKRPSLMRRFIARICVTCAQARAT